MNRKVMMEAL